MDPSSTITITEVIAVLTALGLGSGALPIWNKIRGRNGKPNGSPSAMEVLRSQRDVMERLADSHAKVADTGQHMVRILERVDDKVADTAAETRRLPVIETKVDALGAALDRK